MPHNGRPADLLLASTPPHDPAAEGAVLGACLLDSRVVPACAELLREDDFYRPRHAAVWAGIVQLAARGEPVDDLALVRELRALGRLEAAGGPAAVARLTLAVPSAANAPYHARRVRELAETRHAIVALARAQRVLLEDVAPPLDRLARAAELVRAGLAQPARGPDRREPVLVRMDGIERRAVAWAWEPYLPAGMLTLLEGEPSAGKTWLALAIAAALSRGDALPGAAPRPPAATLYLTAEDPLPEVLAPRLDALGADSARVHVLEAWRTARGREGQVTLRDLDVLDAACAAVRPALVVVDPLQAYLGEDVDMHRANEVRPVLRGLAALAQHHAVAVVLVRHFAKAPAGRAANRGLGSIDFFAAARSVLQAGRVEDEGGDVDGAAPVARALVHAKCSVGHQGPALGYAIERGLGVRWTGLADVVAADLQAPEGEGGPAIREAAAFLRAILEADPQGVLAERACADAAREGIAVRTTQRAAERLRVVRVRDGPSGPWRWRLPRAWTVAPTAPMARTPGVLANVSPESHRRQPARQTQDQEKSSDIYIRHIRQRESTEGYTYDPDAFSSDVGRDRGTNDDASPSAAR